MKLVLFSAWVVILFQEEGLLGSSIATVDAEMLLDSPSATKESFLNDSKAKANGKDSLSPPSLSLRDNIPKGLEDFYKPIAAMTRKERLIAAEYFFEEFKKATAELPEFDDLVWAEFSEIEGRFQDNLEETESTSTSIATTIQYLRSAASLRLQSDEDDNEDWEDEYNVPEDEDEDYHDYDLRARLHRKLQSLPSQVHQEKKIANLPRSEVPSSSRKRATGGRNHLFSSSLKEDTSFARNFVDSLPHGRRASGELFRRLLEEEETDEYVDSGRKPRAKDHRQLETKEAKCEQLAECASRMSLFDLFVSFHSDDIDPVTGVLDENIVFFDEVDIIEIASRISNMAGDILDNETYGLCDSLLEELHRTVEFGGVPQWEGATISQVCLAQGSTASIDYASLYEALVPDLPQEEELELSLKKLNISIQKYMLGGGTDKKLQKIFAALFKIYETLSLPRRKEAFNLVNLLAQESFGCAEELFNSPDRTGNPLFEGNQNIFARSNTNPFGEQTVRPSNAIVGTEGRGTSFDDGTFLSGFVGKINTITVYYASQNVRGLETTYVRQGGKIETISHGRLTGSTDTISFAETPLREVIVWERNNTSNGFTTFSGIEFRDAKGTSFGPYGRTESVALVRPVTRRAAFVGDEREAIIGFRGEDDELNINRLGVYYQSNAIFDFFVKPTVGYKIPTGISTEGSGRTEHGQITGDGASSFAITSTYNLLEDYSSCLNRFIGPIRGLVQVFERVHALGHVQTGDGFDSCDNDPTNQSFICQELNKVGLLPVDEQNPFLCGTGGIISYDGTFCCSSTGCSTNACGSFCPETSTSQFPFVELAQRKLCCEEDIRRNAFECSDASHLGCKIPTGERWYDVAFRVASEQVLEAIDSGKTCASEYFEAVQHGQQLVLGETSSAPGFVCGIANAVVDEDKPVPGTCCLDAPYELSDADWGLSYECSVECQNLAPYIAGLSEEACDVFGGTWCPNPTDCTILQDCIADLMTTFRDQPRLQAFTMYLGAAPNITDPADYDQCGSTREFFGFDAGFINDDQICDDIEQLRFSRDFQFLEDFFGVGSGSSGGSEGPPEDIPPPAAEVPPLSLTMPERAVSESAPVQSGQAWRSTNFALDQATQKAEAFFSLVDAIECPLDPKFKKANICLKIKNGLLAVQQKIVAAAKLVHAVSDFTYGELAEIDNVGQITILENTNAIFANMELTGDYLQERFMDLNEFIRGDNVAIKERLDFIAERADNIEIKESLDGISDRLGLVLNHFGIIEARKLYGIGRDKNVHNHLNKQQLPRANNNSNSNNKNNDEYLHQVQIEILSSTPKKFVCGVVRHKDGELSPEILEVETLDSITEARIPLADYRLVDLGKGSILVTIPNSVDSNMFFVNLGLKREDSDEIIAEHSLLVSFPVTSSD